MQQADQRLKVIKQLLCWQLAGAVAAGLVGMLWGASGALGAFAGGLIAWLPNCYFAFRAFRHKGARAARQIVRSFYAGVTGKIFLTASLFALAFISLDPLNAPAVFIGFIAVQALSWIVPLIAAQRQVSI